MTVQSVRDELPARLTAAKGAVESAREALKLALQQRNDVIIAAVDAGMYQHDVARYVGVKQPQVVRILANPAYLVTAA